MRRYLTSIAISVAVLGGAAASTGPAHGDQRVAVELVLAVDTSISVDSLEYDLQITGIADAFRSPEILRLIMDQPGGVAVTLVHWSVGSLNRQAVAWHHLYDPVSVLNFAAMVELAPRKGAGRGTSIGDAITYSVKLIEENGFAGQARKIDISGDARSNSGPSPVYARDRAVSRKVTINGLVIPDGDVDLERYFRAFVIGGDDAFVMTADRDGDFAVAMRKKLARELDLKLSKAGQGIGSVCCGGR